MQCQQQLDNPGTEDYAALQKYVEQGGARDEAGAAVYVVRCCGGPPRVALPSACTH